MHLQAIHPGILATPAASAEWGDYAGFIRSQVPAHKRVILVSGADWDAVDPVRQAHGVQPGRLVAATKQEFYRYQLADRLQALRKFFTGAALGDDLDEVQIQHYALEDIVRAHLVQDDDHKQAGLHLTDKGLPDTCILYLNCDRDTFRQLNSIAPASYNYEADIGPDRDWRVHGMLHELGHDGIDVRLPDDADQIAVLAEEMGADTKADTSYAALIEAGVKLDSRIPNLMAAARCMQAFLIPDADIPRLRHFPRLDPFTDATDIDSTQGVWDDYYPLTRMLGAFCAAQQTGRNLISLYQGADWLQQNDFLNARQAEMATSLQQSVRDVLDTECLNATAGLKAMLKL
jgi:hypothetical protein